MCVILICPNKIRPDLDTLKACAKANPHGAGIAWREGGNVRWVKTNDLNEIYRLAQAKRGEIVIHFRIASVGAVCNELRHPFPVSKRAGLADQGTAKAVLFQNGTWGAWQRALEFAASEGHQVPEGEMSDARAAAFLCSIYGSEFLEDCAPSRWVFFSANSISTFGQWHKVGGILFSNTFWRKVEKSKPATSSAVPKTPRLENTGRMELWDMSTTKSYWDTVMAGTPKPKRAK